MPRRYSSKTVLLLLVAPALAVVLIVTVVLTRPAQERWLANQRTAEIESLPDDRVGPAVQRLTELDDALSIEALVKLLTSPRTSVVDAARTTLLEQTSRWAALPKSDESKRLAKLAGSLARHLPEMSPRARSLAAELAQHVLLRPLDSEVVDGPAVLADCDAVLSAFAQRRPPTASRQAAAAQQFDPLEESRHARRQRLARSESERADDLVQSSHLPGGGIPVHAVDVPTLPEQEKPPPSGAQPYEAGAPRVLVKPHSGAQPIRPLVEPELLPRDQRRRSQRKETPIEEDAPPSTRGALRNDSFTESRSHAASKDDPAEDQPLDVSKRSTLAVIRALQSDDATEVQTAEFELGRRGMTDRDIRFAYRLCAADANSRRRLVDELLTIPNFDPTPWLFWLSHDPSADVRYAALSLLATSEDERMIRRVEEATLADADPRIIQLGQRLATLRRQR